MCVKGVGSATVLMTGLILKYCLLHIIISSLFLLVAEKVSLLQYLHLSTHKP